MLASNDIREFDVALANNAIRSWAPALLLLAVSFLGTAALALRAPDTGTAPVAAIFPPWWGSERVLAAAADADAIIVREGAWPAILVVKSKHGDFAARLHAAGAWLLVDPRSVAACLKENT